MSSYPMSCNIAHVRNIRQSCIAKEAKLHGNLLSKTAITESISTKPSTNFTTPVALFHKPHSTFAMVSNVLSKYFKPS